MMSGTEREHESVSLLVAVLVVVLEFTNKEGKKEMLD